MPRLSLRIDLDPKGRIGPGKIELLEHIAAFGSISAAARRMNMSYKHAWSLLDEMNRLFGRPLIAAHKGGAGGGSTQLTQIGLAVVTRYRAIERAALASSPTSPAMSEAIARASPLACSRTSVSTRSWVWEMRTKFEASRTSAIVPPVTAISLVASDLAWNLNMKSSRAGRSAGSHLRRTHFAMGVNSIMERQMPTGMLEAPGSFRAGSLRVLNRLENLKIGPTRTLFYRLL